MAKYFDTYDRILFLDADILVRDDCPNLFDLVDVDRVAAYDEGSTLWHFKISSTAFTTSTTSQISGAFPKPTGPASSKKARFFPTTTPA
jgi:lipopolysaccharide biosynthesis glycosyltransferase